MSSVQNRRLKLGAPGLGVPASLPACLALGAPNSLPPAPSSSSAPAFPVSLRPLRFFLSALLFSLLLCSRHLNADDSTTAFDTANRLYAEGRFTEAAGAYERILESGRASPALYFNLGNAFFKSGRMGRAIAAYRQAGQITPRDPDLRANLQFARNQVQGPTLRVGRWERWFGTLSLNEWTSLAAAAIWLTFALLTVRQMRPALARSLRNWTFAAGAAAVLLVVCAALAFAAGSTRELAIIVLPEATVRSSPLESAPNAFTVRDGAELRVLDQKDDWLQVTDGTQRIGWVRNDAALIPSMPRTSHGSEDRRAAS